MGNVAKIDPAPASSALTPMEMLNNAVERGAEPETLGKLMDLQERWESRQAKAAYDADMAAMQARLPVIEKTRDGHGWKFADWGDIKRQINHVLTAHGFAVTHRTEARESDIVVTAICSHREGHREETSLPLPYDTSGSKNAVQARGSSIQYGTRYTGCAILGIAVGGEDKDGFDPSKPTPNEEAAPIIEMIETAQSVDIPGFKDRVTREAEKRKISPAAFKIVQAKFLEALRKERAGEDQ